MYRRIVSLTKYVEDIILWIRSRLSQRQFILFSAVLTGISGGLAAILLKSSVHFVYARVTSSFKPDFYWIYVIITPALGIMLCVWYVKKFHQGIYTKGIASILYAIAQRSGYIPFHHVYSHIITSSLTVGTGGSAGLEGPIVKTGAAVGSNYARKYRLSYKDRLLLLGCGVSSGIAAAFNAPIAGVLFAMEVILPEVTITAFIPLLISSACGALVSYMILDETVLIFFRIPGKFLPFQLPYYVLLGIFCGLISLYYAKIFSATEKFAKTFTQKKIIRAGILSMLTGVFFVFLPAISGEGYEFIRQLSSENPENAFRLSILRPFISHQEALLFFILLCILVKPLAVGITLGSGGNGGNFAPSMFVGAAGGYLFSSLLNRVFELSLPVISFMVVGMAGTLSGIFYAPLTSIFLIAEITGGYMLIIPLMMVVSLSFGLARYFEPYSMDTRRLAEKGQIFTSDIDKNILTLMKTRQFIEKDFHPVHPEMTLGELVQIISRSRRNIFPVLDTEKKLYGVVLLGDVRELMFKTEFYDKVRVKELMRQAPAIIDINEDMYSVMKKFDENDVWNLPVEENGIYVGFISKSGIFNSYRELLDKIRAE
jgi:CIC family chloride channel protein